MSDHRAVAGITVALQQLLQDPVGRAVPGAVVRTGMPNKDPLGGASGLVNVFLYQVSPSTEWRNAELPVRDRDGTVVGQAQAALDLHYLLSFYGEESRQVPQVLLGVTVATLHARSRLRAEDIPELLDGKSLEDSGLRQQSEVLRLVQEAFTIDDLSKIWSGFIQQVPYALSVAYRCSVVLIDAGPAPEPVPVVREVELETRELVAETGLETRGLEEKP